MGGKVFAMPMLLNLLHYTYIVGIPYFSENGIVVKIDRDNLIMPQTRSGLITLIAFEIVFRLARILRRTQFLIDYNKRVGRFSLIKIIERKMYSGKRLMHVC